MVYTGTAATDLQSTPVFMKAKIPVVMLAPSDRWDNGKAWPYFFDNYPLNKPTMAYMARFAKRIGITKIGIIDDSSTFASTLEKDFYPAAAAAGLPITKRVSYSPTAVDVTTQVRELEASGANGVALLAEGGLGHVYDAMREVGWTPPIVTTAAAGIVGYSSLGSLAAHAYDNCSVALEPGQQPDPGLAQIMHVVEAKIGVNPFAATSLITNDDFLILKRAIEQTHTLEGTAIAHAIEQFRNVSFTSPNYRYTFTPTHHDGWPNSEIHMCSLAHFGPGDLPIIANP
jgi:ABC-type branched-subunit amino acid transport system substrate-binding protein